MGGDVRQHDAKGIHKRYYEGEDPLKLNLCRSMKAEKGIWCGGIGKVVGHLRYEVEFYLAVSTKLNGLVDESMTVTQVCGLRITEMNTKTLC